MFAIPKGNNRLTTIDFQVRAVSFREGIGVYPGTMTSLLGSITYPLLKRPRLGRWCSELPGLVGPMFSRSLECIPIDDSCVVRPALIPQLIFSTLKNGGKGKGSFPFGANGAYFQGLLLAVGFREGKLVCLDSTFDTLISNSPFEKVTGNFSQSKFWIYWKNMSKTCDSCRFHIYLLPRRLALFGLWDCETVFFWGILSHL